MAIFFSGFNKRQNKFVSVYRMKNSNVLMPVALALAVTAGVAQAGPAVDVTFKNNSAEKVTYHAEGQNGLSTQMNARP